MASKKWSRGRIVVVRGVHLFPSIDEPLLYGRYAFLFFYSLFDSRDLKTTEFISYCFGIHGPWLGRQDRLNLEESKKQGGMELGEEEHPYFIIWLDVKFDFFTRQGADSAQRKKFA